MKVSVFSFTVLLWITATALSQESVRRVDGAGQYNKFLTPGTLDRWIVQVEEGETIIAHVRTREFDPVLELATPGAKEDTVLFSIDDEGSESWFSHRFTRGGEYRIRVHGYEFKGGGNYALSLRRFKAKPVTVGKPTVGTFDRRGHSYHHFQADKDQMLTVAITGAQSWEMLDVKGRPVNPWRGSVRHDQQGEYSLVLSGKPGTRYELHLRLAKRKQLALNAPAAGKLDEEMDVYAFEGQVGEFRVIEIKQRGDVAARLVHAPMDRSKDQRIPTSERPAIRYLRSVNKGGTQRFAVILGYKDRYQVQIISRGESTYELKMTDPTISIPVGQKSARKLPVGAAAYYQFKVTPGQLIIARLISDQFDPFLRLFDSQGQLLAENDDGDGGTGSRIAHLVLKEQTLQLHVTSLGNGGGGSFELSLEEKKAKPLTLGKTSAGKLDNQSTDHWSFEGKKGESVFFNVRSSSFDPYLTIRSPDGVILRQDDNGGVGTDSLLAIRFPRDGTYTLWVTSQRGQGAYVIRAIKGE
jgi:hypothetical protein